MNVFLLISVAITLVLAAQPTDDNLVISLPDGKIRGASYVTPNNVTYNGWTGIPFASPPVGSLRFQAPQPPKPWNGILDTTQIAPDCISINYWSNNAESEDCLYLNVFTPALKQSEKLPVMVFIYGGAFNSGTSSKWVYGPDFLIEKDVIIVTFNYRVDTFGLLSTADSEIPGNAGLKDQRLALKWTKANIELFGGDPEKITIFGESAGGASVGLQLVSSSTAGLYRAAIAQSGTSVIPWAIKEDPRPMAFKLADLVGGGNYGNDTKKLTQFLQEKTTDEIVNATINLYSAEVNPALPVIEVEHEDAFLTEAPYGILESGRFNQVPLIIGVCSAEWLLFIQDADAVAQAAKSLDSDPNALIPSNLGQNISDNAAVSDAIRNIYLRKEETFSNNYKAVVDYFSDNVFVRSVIKHAELAAKYVPVYLYQFSYAGRSFDHFQIDGYKLAGHADDLKFLFYSGLTNVTDTTSLLVQDRMVKLWTNFAKYLDPTPEPSELLNNVTWPRLQSAASQFLNINSTLSIQSNLRRGYAQWNEVYQRYGRKPFITF